MQHKDGYLAHISEDGSCYQSVIDHLIGTARRAERFAAPFGGGEQAFNAGMMHDTGKYQDEFQEYIRGSGIRVDHSTAGAQEAKRLHQPDAAFAIAGHHGGIPDGGSKIDLPTSGTLMGRLQKKLGSYDAWEREAKDKLKEIKRPERKWSGNFSRAFYIRMLFSCLVDADYLDTEEFMRGTVPRGGYADITELLERLETYISRWKNPDNELNSRRNDILKACLKAGSENSPGLYTLTVPTGGGKTISSLAFALRHAVANGLSRVIYVIPYTSIIDQTAEVFKDMLGEENVIEHHSGVEQYASEYDLDAVAYRKLLATENWDAPVIVTTAVQFFESLFSNRPSRCRKLHNIASSVIIFDETQTLPVDCLKPCVAAIGELVKNYCATAVMCTATQPALERMFDELAHGMKSVEICPNPHDMYSFFRRTELRHRGTIAQEELAARLSASPQVLCVVNRRATARELHALLPKEGSYCLTTLLCARDRKRLIAEIRKRLLDGLPCRVVSTSLIEAGVDINFPEAWREEAGLDSILQTAGRCNREGKNPREKSIVTVFRLSGQSVIPSMRKNVDSTIRVMNDFDDMASLEAIRSYFESYYAYKGDAALDKKDILRLFDAEFYPFAKVAERFKLIDSHTYTLYIPVYEGKALVGRLLSDDVDRGLYRRLGQYSVNVYKNHIERLIQAGAAKALGDEQFVLMDINAYDCNVGLSMDAETGMAIFG